MSYIPTPEEWLKVGAEALLNAVPDWEEHTSCDCASFEASSQKATDEHWNCPIPWPSRTYVAMEVIRGLREAGVLKVMPENTSTVDRALADWNAMVPCLECAHLRSSHYNVPDGRKGCVVVGCTCLQVPPA